MSRLCICLLPYLNKIIKMSQTINMNNNITSIPIWMSNIVHPINSFELEIANKISPYPHYAGPIHNFGGLHIGSYCRIPGVQPFKQQILRPKVCIPHYLTKHCYEYGNTRFPPTCNCNEKYGCRCSKLHCNRNCSCFNSCVIHY